MSSTLTPIYAANLAADVYNVKSAITREDFVEAYKTDMEIGDGNFSFGVTGGYIIKKPHVMAVFSAGKEKYKGQAFIAIKGTASLYDALTDLNAGVRSSHTGFPVHQGFYYAFDSILVELRKFLSGLKGISVVHCVGHSLGGAIATLAADWTKANSAIPTVKLYTFGSPRVGLEGFAAKCTSRLIAQNIYRAYHRTDPVPMVPTWPFYHVSNTDNGYLIDSPISGVPWEYHLMKYYIKSTRSLGSWKNMAGNRPASMMDSAVESWLKSDSIMSYAASALEILNAAFIYVIKKVINLAGIALVTGAAGSLTLMDRMAMFMAKAAKVSKDLSIWVFYLVRKMASLIGIKIKEGVDLTVAFIRKIFMNMHSKISEMIWRIGQEVS
jgi:triacylglycerol lipase